MTVECTGCGKCCEQGGPTLHVEDLKLIEDGVIQPRHLITIRRGEPASNQIEGMDVALGQELIKLRGKGGKWTCLFYLGHGKGCGIYENRPLECRELFCQDTSRLEAIYDKDRLSREHVAAPGTGMHELIQEHEKHCDYGLLTEHATALNADMVREKQAAEEILSMVRYDRTIRKLLIEKGGARPEDLDLYFGRPLETLLRPLGLRLARHGNTEVLKPINR